MLAHVDVSHHHMLSDGKIKTDILLVMEMYYL